jgi:hypothetical protein
MSCKPVRSRNFPLLTIDARRLQTRRSSTALSRGLGFAHRHLGVGDGNWRATMRRPPIPGACVPGCRQAHSRTPLGGSNRTAPVVRSGPPAMAISTKRIRGG